MSNNVLTDSNGNPYKFGDKFIRTNVFADHFQRPDGEVSNDWLDIADTLPTYFDASYIQDNFLMTTVPGVLSTWPTPPAAPPALGYVVARNGIYRPTTLSDNFEVTVEQYVTVQLGLLHQLGPMVLVDPNADEFELGLMLWWDISVGTFQILATFKGESKETMFRNSDYNIYTQNVPVTEYNATGYHTHTVRVVDNEIEGLVDGERVAGPIPVPAWAQGRLLHGASVLQIMTEIGRNDPFYGVPATEYYPAQINKITIAPYNQPLVAPDPVSIGSMGSVVKTGAVSSVNIPYPATVNDGEKLIALVGTDNAGDIVAPDGWTLTEGQRVLFANQFGMYWFEKTAIGDETGNVTFAKASGTGVIGGFMFTLRNLHPRTFSATPVMSPNFAASTSIFSLNGKGNTPNQLQIWAGGMSNNEAITPPTGFTTVDSSFPGVVRSYVVIVIGILAVNCIVPS